jgi:hypothetical protein
LNAYGRNSQIKGKDSIERVSSKSASDSLAGIYERRDANETDCGEGAERRLIGRIWQDGSGWQDGRIWQVRTLLKGG